MSDKDRKIISWRLERLSERERQTINLWADKQDNIQQSLTNIILHAIKRFGVDTDIMQFDVQQILHAENLGLSVAPAVVATSPVATTVVPQVTTPQPTAEKVDPPTAPPSGGQQQEGGGTQNGTQKTTDEESQNGTQKTTDDDGEFELPTATQNEQQKEGQNGDSGDTAKNELYQSAGDIFNT